MTHERPSTPAHRRPYEQFGLTEREALFWRISQERFQSILEDEQTLIHRILESNNEFGEFLFVTTSRPGAKERIAMTFYGLGFHEHRERWITEEWFWYQSELYTELAAQQIPKEEARRMLQERRERIAPELGQETQTERGQFFEFLADMTDEDGALAEMEDFDSIGIWIFAIPKAEIPRKTELLDAESREKLPKLYSNEERGLEALAQVKFFTPDSDWTWYASEFDGEDLFFGLVSGFDIEFGYFSLKELQEARGPLGLPIERDLDFEPKTLGELEEMHRKQREG